MPGLRSDLPAFPPDPASRPPGTVPLPPGLPRPGAPGIRSATPHPRTSTPQHQANLLFLHQVVFSRPSCVHTSFLGVSPTVQGSRSSDHTFYFNSWHPETHCSCGMISEFLALTLGPELASLPSAVSGESGASVCQDAAQRGRTSATGLRPSRSHSWSVTGRELLQWTLEDLPGGTNLQTVSPDVCTRKQPGPLPARRRRLKLSPGCSGNGRCRRRPCGLRRE